MRKLLTQLRPTTFEDIIAVLALFRPGPLDSGMVEQFIKRKHGKEEVKYPHPKLEPILRETYGVIVYQEQVMQIAQVLAGYSLGDADNLRRAMGKKDAEQDEEGARALHRRRRPSRRFAEQARGRDLRPDGDLRRVRLQQVALRRLRAGLVPDGVPEGALSAKSSWPG